MKKLFLLSLLVLISCNENQVRWTNGAVSTSLDSRVATLESISERHDQLIQLLVSNGVEQGESNESFRNDIDALFILIQETRDQVAQNKGDVDGSLARIDLALSELSSRMTTQEDINANQQLQIDEIFSRLENMDNLNSLQDDFLRGLSLDVCLNSNRMDVIQLQINALGGLFAGLADEHSNLSQAIATNTSNILSNEVRLNSVEHELSVHAAMLNSFESRVNTLEAQIVILGGNNNSFFNELSIIQTVIATLNININEVNFNFTNLVESQLADLTARVQHEEMLSSAQAVVNLTVDDRLSILEQAQQANRNLINIVIGDIAGVISSSSYFTNIVENITLQLSQIFIQIDGSHNDQQAQINILIAQINSLNIQVNDQYTQIVQNTNSVSDLNNLVSQIESTVNANSVRLGLLESEFSSLNASVSNINALIANWGPRVVNLENGQSDLESIVTILNSQVAQNILNINSVENRVTVNEVEIDGLRVLAGDLEGKFNQLLARIQINEGAVVSLDQRVSELERVQATHSSLISVINSSLVSINITTGDLSVQINSLFQILNDFYFGIPSNINDVLAVLNLEISNLQTQINSMNLRITDLEVFRTSMLDNLNVIHMRLINLESICASCDLDSLRVEVDDLLLRVIGIEGRESLYLQESDLTDINNSISEVFTVLINHEESINSLISQVNENRTEIELNSLRLTLVEQVNAQQTVFINLLNQSVEALEIAQVENNARFSQLELMVQNHVTILQSQITTMVGLVEDNSIRIDELELAIIRIDLSLAGFATIIENMGGGIEIIDPCGKSNHSYDEVVLKINGEYIAWFISDHHGHHSHHHKDCHGHKHHKHHGYAGLSVLPDGNFQTTDKQKCHFSVENGNLTW